MNPHSKPTVKETIFLIAGITVIAFVTLLYLPGILFAELCRKVVGGKGDFAVLVALVNSLFWSAIIIAVFYSP